MQWDTFKGGEQNFWGRTKFLGGWMPPNKLYSAYNENIRNLVITTTLERILACVKVSSFYILAFSLWQLLYTFK